MLQPFLNSSTLIAASSAASSIVSRPFFTCLTSIRHSPISIPLISPFASLSVSYTHLDDALKLITSVPFIQFPKLILTAIELTHTLTSNNYTRKLLLYEYNKSAILQSQVK